MNARMKSSTAIARPSIFSALVGPRILLAPDDGGGNGGGDAEGGAAGGGAGGADAGSGGAGGDAGGAAGGGGAGGGASGGDAAAGGDDGAGSGKSLLEQAAAGDGTKKDGAAGDGDKSGDGKGAEADAGPKDVDGNAVPENYEIKMPDGVSMDADLLAAVSPIFREHKFSPAQAQAAADFYMQQQTKQLEAHAKQTADWAKEAQADKEIGGAAFKENMAHAHKALQAFGSERSLQIFDTYGLGNNPEILRMFVRIGKAIGEGGTVLAGDGGGEVSAAKAMYPSMHQGR